MDRRNCAVVAVVAGFGAAVVVVAVAKSPGRLTGVEDERMSVGPSEKITTVLYWNILILIKPK